MLLLAGYVYLYDNDEVLKEDILKSFFITIAHSILKLFFGHIPTIIGWISTLFVEIKGLNIINKYIRVLVEVLEFVRIIILLKLAADAYSRDIV